MKVSVEIDNLHDVIMLDMIIDMWKDKWKADEAEAEEDDDDAEEEQCDCEDEESEDGYESFIPETAEEKAHRKALRELEKAMRDAGISGVDLRFVGNVRRRKSRG